MEPIMCNSSVVLPKPGYMEVIRKLCARHGIVLIFHEVITGFRVALGGAQQFVGVTPDLAVFAKAMASGVPSQTKLPLQEKRRDATFIRGHEVSRPEPNRQRRFRVMQNRPCRMGDLIPAPSALPAPWYHDFERTLLPAPRAEEAIRPAAHSQIRLASR